MALDIDDAQTDRLVRELARITGESVSVAIRTAIEERLARVRPAAAGAHGLDAIVARGRGRADTARSAGEMVDYDSDGLP